MDIRVANINDLENLIDMYRKVVVNMKNNGIDIWDEVYPTCCFSEDIKNKAMYVVTKNDEIVASFSIYENNNGESHVKWIEDCNEVYYIGRFAINIDYMRNGIGSKILKFLSNLAIENRKKYLRLFVVDINRPAINFYVKNGFSQAEGKYEYNIEGFILKEYGYEIRCLM